MTSQIVRVEELKLVLIVTYYADTDYIFTISHCPSLKTERNLDTKANILYLSLVLFGL